MRRTQKAQEPLDDEQFVQDKTGQRPDLAQILEKVLEHEDLDGQEVVRMELNVYPSRDATWRAFLAGQGEPVGGYITVD